VLREKAPAKIAKYVATLECFNEVVHACYSQTLDDDYERIIEKFKVSFLSLRISVTPKVHAVFHHVAEFCTKTEMGLGPWSEQTSEAVHHDFEQMWKHFKVKDEETTKYGENLLRAVQMYNSQHL
jgi:hypothetical protein